MTTGIKRRKFGGDLEDILRISAIATTSDQSIADSLEMIMVTKLIPGTYQPRRHFDDEALRSLADSIKEKGILQPIIARRSGPNDYEIIAGERRWRAAQMAGLQQVPVIVKEISNENALAFGIIENIQRKDLNPIEEANSFKRLLNEFKLTHDEVAKSVGRSRAAITNMLRLLDLADPVRVLLEAGQIQMGHAKAILKLNNELQVQAAKEVVANGLSVRGTETLVNRLSEGVSKKTIEAIDLVQQRMIWEWQRKIERQIPAEVSIKIKPNGEGQILLKFYTPQELEETVSALCGMPLVES